MAMLRSLIDSALEATIVGSFTKIGPAVRSQVAAWEPVDADLGDQTIVITGGSTGIGRETARRLVELGATVYLSSRDLDRARSAAAEISDALGPGSCGTAIGISVDTGEPSSVRALAAQLESDVDRIDVLIHNAGALTDRYQETTSGHEATLASHLIGPYALTTRLRPRLAPGARVLWMSSGGMYTQGLDLDRLEMTERKYQGSVAYARAKRAQVELVRYLAPRWAPDVVMHTMHPGWVDTDGVAQGLPLFGTIMGPLLRDIDTGADTMVWLAAGGGDSARPGRFWLDRRPRSIAYLPGTGTDDTTRAQLVEWLDAQAAAFR